MIINEKRLLRLARRLINLKASRGRKFDLAVWYRTNCQTTACAVGEAGLLKEFNKEGFRLEEHQWQPKRMVPTFEGHRNWPAVEAFFGLTDTQAGYLFSDTMYPPAATARQVAKRILAFVASGGKVQP